MEVYWIYIGLLVNFRIRNQEGKTSWPQMGKLQKRKNIIWTIIWKRGAFKEDWQGSMIVSCEITFFVCKAMHKHHREEVFTIWDHFAQPDFTYRMSESEYFNQTKLVDLSQKVWRHWRAIEKPFWLQPSVVYTKPLTPRNWGTATQAHAPLEVLAMETGIEFFLHLVAMQWILVAFWRNQRKSMHGKVYDRTWLL